MRLNRRRELQILEMTCRVPRVGEILRLPSVSSKKTARSTLLRQDDLFVYSKNERETFETSQNSLRTLQWIRSDNEQRFRISIWYTRNQIPSLLCLITKENFKHALIILNELLLYKFNYHRRVHYFILLFLNYKILSI
jgi:hypothetical protein